MISETQFSRGFKHLAQNIDPEYFRELRIKGIGEVPGLVQCFDPSAKRIGLGIRIMPGEPLPNDLPPDSNKAIVSILEAIDNGALLLIARADRCMQATFSGIARGIANHFAKQGDYSVGGFIAAIEEWIPETKQPPPFPYKKQAGLMGELYVLEHDLFPHFSNRQCISFWQGPMANAKDFILPSCCIEVKATKSTDDHSFWVSNDDQFLVPENCPMFLRFITFNENQSDSESVPHVVERIRRKLTEEPDVEREFIRAVKKAGYNPKHRRRYDNIARFTHAADYYFEVTGIFPRLLLGNVQKALKVDFLAAIKYSISVDSLRKDFELKPPTRRYWQVLKGRVSP